MKYYKNYQNVTQRPEVSKCFWKNGTSRFAQFRITPKLQFIKNAISLKGSKTIKWGIPVYILASIFVILYHRLNIIISQIILLERELKYINNLLTNKHYSNSLLLPLEVKSCTKSQTSHDFCHQDPTHAHHLLYDCWQLRLML